MGFVVDTEDDIGVLGEAARKLEPEFGELRRRRRCGVATVSYDLEGVSISETVFVLR